LLRRRKKNIYIFLNNKIISLDTIVPLILEVKKRNNLIKINFITFDFTTHQFIKKNKLLYKVVNEIGNMVCLGREKNSNYFTKNFLSKYHYKRLNIIIHILKILPYFIKLIYNLIFFNVIFIHFRALNTFPLNLLYYLNSNNTVLFSADSSGYSYKAYNADIAIHEKVIDTNITSALTPKGKKVVSFSNYWPLLKHPSLKTSKKYIIKSSHSRKYWIDYLKNNFENMFKEDNNIDIKNNYCLLLLGHIGTEVSGAKFLKYKNSWTTIIEDILDIIHEEWPDLTILVKPHIITDMTLLNNILSKRKNTKTVITYLHPALVSVKSKFSIASYYTTAFQSIHDIGGITIEYTDQKEIYRKKLNYQSKRPEFTSYFFNDNEEGFRSLLRDINNGRIKTKLKYGYDDDPTNLLHYLSK